MNLAPFEWLEDCETLRWSALIGGEAHTLTVSQACPGGLEVSVTGDANSEEVEQCVRRVLMLDWNAFEAARVAERCDQRVASMIEAGGGRLLRGSSAFEDVVKTICTINTSWSNTQSMIHRLTKLSEVGAFPSPSEILTVGADGLRREAHVGYRADTIMTVAKLAHKETLDDVAIYRLADLRGLGPYATAHISVLRGDYSVIPVDSEVRSYCVRHLGMRQPDTDTVHDHFSAWGSYRFLGYKLGRMASSTNWIGE